MVILDTNILIDHLRRAKKEESYLENIVKGYPKETLAISMVSVQELYEGKSTKEKNKEMLVLTLLTSFKILPYTYDSACHAGEIARDLPRPIEFPDAVIAATVLENDCQLATLNKKDFRGIKGLEFITFKNP